MNKVDFLGHKVSKLIVGDNPLSGHSYITYKTTGDEMINYYTAENCKKLFRHLEELGYNTMLPLAHPYMIRLLQEYQAEGGNLQLIWQPYLPMTQEVSMREMKKLNTIGIYHQGTTTDYLFESKNYDKIKENIELWRQLDVPVGIGTHRPDVIRMCEEENWNVDFYMACMQNSRQGREGEPSGFLTGKTKDTLTFFPKDRPIMLNTLKDVSKPIIAFKIFAGGQMFNEMTEDQIKHKIKDSYEEVFSVLKPNDIGAIGVFQRDKDEAAEDAQLYDEWYNEKYGAK